MFRDLWNHQEQQVKDRVTRLKSDLSQQEAKTAQLVDKMLDTDNETVVSHIEKRIATMDDKTLKIRDSIAQMSEKRPRYDELFELALTFLANPWKMWEKGDFNERRNLLKMVFPNKVRYSRKTGVRTPQVSVPYTFFGNDKKMAHRGCAGLRT